MHHNFYTIKAKILKETKHSYKLLVIRNYKHPLLYKAHHQNPNYQINLTKRRKNREVIIEKKNILDKVYIPHKRVWYFKIPDYLARELRIMTPPCVRLVDKEQYFKIQHPY